MDKDKIKRFLFSNDAPNVLLGWELLKGCEQKDEIIREIKQLYLDLNIGVKNIKKLTLNHIKQINKINYLWEGTIFGNSRQENSDMKYLGNLETINFDSRYGLKTPNFIWYNPNIKTIKISNFWENLKIPNDTYTTNLITLDLCISTIKGLENLNLTNLYDVKIRFNSIGESDFKLTDKIWRKMTNLKYLTIINCRNLEIDEAFFNETKLEHIEIISKQNDGYNIITGEIRGNYIYKHGSYVLNI